MVWESRGWSEEGGVDVRTVSEVGVEGGTPEGVEFPGPSGTVSKVGETLVVWWDVRDTGRSDYPREGREDGGGVVPTSADTVVATGGVGRGRRICPTSGPTPTVTGRPRGDLVRPPLSGPTS